MSDSQNHDVSGVDLELEDVTKRYPGQDAAAVDGLSLHVPAGEIVMFVGPSGCGKTTSLKMINRLIEPTSGTITIDGNDVRKQKVDDLRRHIGYVIQGGSLFPHMTVAQNIALVPKLLGWESKKVESRVDELLDLVGLDAGRYRERYPRELSGGQQQRVGVARGLAADPPVVLMDEPFGAVDPITRQRLQDELLRIQAELRKTIVCVTHDIDEAVKLGDRILILREGAEIAQYDTPENDPGRPGRPVRGGLRRCRLLPQAADPDPGQRRRAQGVPHRQGRRGHEQGRRTGPPGRPQVRRRARRARTVPGRGCGSATSRRAATRSASRGATTSSAWTSGPPSTTRSTTC